MLRRSIASLTFVTLLPVIGLSQTPDGPQTSGPYKKSSNKPRKDLRPFDATEQPVVISDASIGTRVGPGHKKVRGKKSNSGAKETATVSTGALYLFCKTGWHDPGPNGQQTVYPNGREVVPDTKDDGSSARADWSDAASSYWVQYFADGAELVLTFKFVDRANNTHAITASTSGGRRNLSVTTDQNGCVFKKLQGRQLSYYCNGAQVVGHIDTIALGNCAGSNCGPDTTIPPSITHINYQE